jgi:hypothetical protein
VSNWFTVSEILLNWNRSQDLNCIAVGDDDDDDGHFTFVTMHNSPPPPPPPASPIYSCQILA